MLNSLVGILIDLFAVLGALFALWRGGAAERATALVVLANVVVGEVGSWLAPSIDPAIRLVNDGLTALALLVITVRFSTLWMGGVMLFYAAQFTLHSFYLVTDRKPDNLHALINNVDFSGITWCMVIGTAVAWRRRLRLAKAA